MRRAASLALALALIGLIANRCSHDDDAVVNPPSVDTPVVDDIQPNPTHADSMIIFIGTHFDQSSTFELRQNGVAKVTLVQRTFATGTPAQGIQVDAMIPAGTPLGRYQACVRTAAGSGCGPALVEVF